MRTAALTRMELSKYGLKEDLQVVLVARSASTFVRLPLGTVGLWNKAPHQLSGLDPAGVLRFRLLLHRADDPKIVASAENLVARDLDQADSFLAMQSADLGDVVWELSWTGGEPVVLFNQAVFPNAKGAIGYPPFAAFVLPEVVRQVMRRIADEPEKLDDSSDPLAVWKALLARLGIDDVPDEESDESDKEAWVKGVVSAFASQNNVAAGLKRGLSAHGD